MSFEIDIFQMSCYPQVAGWTNFVVQMQRMTAGIDTGRSGQKWSVFCTLQITTLKYSCHGASK